LHFEFEGYSPERHHLLTRTAADRQQLANKIAALSADGHSQREISDLLGISLATVNRLLRCADMLMRGCADDEGCADMQMRECADEKAAAPCDSLPGEGREGFSQPGITYEEWPDTEDPTTQVIQPPPMTNDVMTNDPPKYPTEKAAAPCDSLPGEGREGFSQPGITYEEWPDTEHPTKQVIQPPPMTNDVMPNDKKAIPKPFWGMKTSVIDMALTPELLDHILRTTARDNSIRQKGSDTFNKPNPPANTKTNDGGQSAISGIPRWKL